MDPIINYLTNVSAHLSSDWQTTLITLAIGAWIASSIQFNNKKTRRREQNEIQ